MGLSDAILLAALVLWVPLVAVVHEAGHALLAPIAGYRVTSFGIGRGRPVVRLELPGGVVFHVGWLFFTGGACVAIPRSPDLGVRGALFHGGGIAAQVVLGVLLLGVPDGAWSAWVEAGGQFNFAVAAWNLLPWRLGRVASDGWRLLSRVGGGVVAPRWSLFAQRGAMQAVLDYEQRVGSTVGVWYGDLMLAWADLLVGRVDDGRARLDASAALPVDDDQLAAIGHLVRAEGCLRGGQPMVALRHVTDARGTGLVGETEDLLTVTEARAWRMLGDRGRAGRALERLAGVGGAVGREATCVALELAIDDRDDPAIRSAAHRLVRLSTGGMHDPLRAASMLARAAAWRGSSEESLRWHARAVGIARAAWDHATAEDKVYVQKLLDDVMSGAGAADTDHSTSAVRP